MIVQDWPDTPNAVNYTNICQFGTVNYLVLNFRNWHANFDYKFKVIRFEIKCRVPFEVI